MSYTPRTWQTGETITAAKLNNIEQGIVNAEKMQYGMGTAVASGDNLNNYTTPGVYAVTSSTIAESVANMPATAAGRLEVRESITSGYGTYVIQTYYRTNSQAGDVWIRVKTTDASGFGTWHKLAYSN